MINMNALARSLFVPGLMLFLGTFAVGVYAQHGSGTPGGDPDTAGAVMKVPAKKVTRSHNATPSKPGTRTQPIDTEKLEEALRTGDSEREAGRNESAETSYLAASKISPSDPRPYLGLGHIYYNLKNFSEAEKNYARAASLSKDDSEPYARLAFTYTELHRPDDALSAARRAVAVQTDNYYGYLALGYVLSLRHDYTESETAYRKAVSLAPQPQLVLYNELERILSEQGKYGAAAIEAKKAVDIAPGDFNARFTYAVMLQKLGQLIPSAQQYVEAIKISPKDAAPRSNIGLLYYMTENWGTAREQWTAAVNFGSTYAPDRIGILILNGRFAEARTQLEEYTKTSSNDEDGWLMLGDVCRALGDDARARVADAHAAQIAPEYSGLRRPDLRKLAPKR